MRQKKRLLHQISTDGGQSGSPIVIWEGDKDTVVGIHTGGKFTGPDQAVKNFGRLISFEFAEELAQWQHKHNCAPFQVRDLSSGQILRPLIPPIDSKEMKKVMPVIKESAENSVRKIFNTTSRLKHEELKCDKAVRDRIREYAGVIEEELKELLSHMLVT